MSSATPWQAETPASARPSSISEKRRRHEPEAVGEVLGRSGSAKRATVGSRSKAMTLAPRSRMARE